MTHNNILREEDYICQLKDIIKQQYGMKAIRITPAKRGYYGETWKVEGKSGPYFLKMDYLPFHQKKFQNSLPVIEYLCENGIDFAGKIIKTREHQLYTKFDTAVMGLFEWVDGVNVETDDSKVLEYQMLCKLYVLTKPGFKIPVASFSNEAAVCFYTQWKALKTAPKTNENLMVLSIFQQFEREIAHCASRLSEFSRRCRKDNSGFYLTHGDAGGNFFVGNGRNYIFDWDEIMYAPLERDAWVMGCYDWARTLFNDTLKANKIPYQLGLERLAFYCYHMYFFYLGEFLKVHSICDESDRIRDYFQNGWIKSRIQFADTI